jgi:hypothetical protein
MQHQHGYKWRVTAHERPAAWEEGRQLDPPTTLGKPIGVLMLPETVKKRLEALGDWRYQGMERRAGFRENGKSGCASSEGWRVQRESIPPREKPGAL